MILFASSELSSLWLPRCASSTPHGHLRPITVAVLLAWMFFPRSWPGWPLLDIQVSGVMASRRPSLNSSLELTPSHAHSAHPMLFSQHTTIPFSCVFICSLVCGYLSPQRSALGDQGPHLMSSLLYLQQLKKRLAHSRDSINVYWMNDSVPWLCNKTAPKLG